MQRHHLRLVMTGVLTLVVLSPSASARGSTALPSCPETAPGATGLDVIGRDDLPAGTDVVACDLVGTVVLLDGSGVAGAEIPPPGEGVQLFADPFFGRPTDAESELTVAVDDEGNLAYESDSPAAAGETPLAACDDPASHLKAPRAPMNDGEPIHYDRGTFPGNLSANRVADTLIAGVRAWPRLYSDCDVADTV